jgi:hypothetical protein
MLKNTHQSRECNLDVREMSLCRYNEGIWTKHRAINYGRLRFELTRVEMTEPTSHPKQTIHNTDDKSSYMKITQVRHNR